MLGSVLRFLSLEEMLVADAMVALARKTSREEGKSGSSSTSTSTSSGAGAGAGAWRDSSALSSSSDEEAADSYDGVPAHVVRTIIIRLPACLPACLPYSTLSFFLSLSLLL